MTDILFVRHGQTRANAIGCWHGWSDPPLNATGRSEAEAIAHRLATEEEKIKALYTSPLRRARQTANSIGTHLHLRPQILERLKEIHFGKLEGITLSQMKDQFPELYAQWQDKTDMMFQWPEGERRADFFARATEACERIIKRHSTDRIVIVSHGGTIRACLAYLLPDLLGTWWSYALDNAGLTRVSVTDRDAQLLMLNDTRHLLQERAESHG